VVSNPEFLKEGTAIEDFMRPDRIVIGSDDTETIEKIKELYSPFTINHERFIIMDIRSAEMTKYASNAMLATKISFMNEMANICERVGADINKIRLGIGSDHRIGYHFIYSGIGYGGSCFPKDVQALIKTSSDYNYESKILKAVENVNYDQKKVLIEKIKKRFGDKLDGKKFAVWGLAFKPNTNDMREAPSIVVINELAFSGAKINVYDPQAIEEAKKYYLKNNRNIEYFESKYAALKGCDAMLLLTEWKEFRSPDFEEIGKLLKNKIIFDGRNQYNSVKVKESGFEYYQIGVGNPGSAKIINKI
jgi:UDPglucose 6-dehydrogenase